MAGDPGRLAAILFVILWSTGFVGAKLGLPYAEPMTFLAIRFWIVAAALIVWAAATGALAGVDWRGAALTGVYMHGVYLGAVYIAIAGGAGAGISALIVSMQPLVTAFLARAMLGERLTRAQQIGMALGFLGAGLAVARKLGGGDISGPGVALCLMGLFGIAFGSVYQKQRAATGGVGDNAVQFIAAAAVCTVFAFIFETRQVDWDPVFIATMFWMCAVLSLGAISILYWLIRRGEASETASLFFLVPGVTAVMAWAMFGETYGPLEVAGLLLAMIGVALVSRKGAQASASR